MSYNLDRSHTSPNSTPQSQALLRFGYNRGIEGITIHWWGDPNLNPSFAGIRDYLCRAGGNTSAHFVASGTGRQVAWIVDAMDVAWHSGSAYGNAKTIGIECDPRCRPEDYDVVAELVADIRSAFGDVPIYSHNMWVATACPGGYDIDRIDKLSYTKQSNAEWGQVTNKVNPVPVTPPSQPAPTAPPATLLYKVLKGGKQIGAFAKDINAWNFYTTNSADKITVSGKDITANLKAKFTAPSPTAGQPDSGKAITEKLDYIDKRVSALEKSLEVVLKYLEGIFKSFRR